MKLVMHFHQSSNIFGINRESLLLQVGSSSQGGGDIGLDGGDSGPHLALLNEGGGGLLVEGGDGVGDDGDLSLHGSLVSFQGDGLALQLLVASGGDLVVGLGGGELLAEIVLGLGEGGLGGGVVVLEGSALGVDVSGVLLPGGEGGVGGSLGGLDLLGLLAGVRAQELHLALDGGDLGLGLFVGGRGGFALGGGLGQDSLEFGQALGHLLAALLLGLLLLQGAHLALDHGVELVPGPVSASVVETDVPLDGGDALLFGNLALVGDVDEDAASLALHLHEDLGESALTDLLESRQHTGAEHDLGGTATERVGVHAGGDESLLGALSGVSGQVGEDLGSDDGVTRHEVGVGDLVGQTQHANTDAFEHAVAVELMHDKRSVDVTGLLDLVGDDASDKVRVSRVQVGHQLHQRLPVGSGNGHHGSTLLLGAVILLREDKGDDGVAGGGHHADDSLVDGILVLEEPASDVVSDGTGVVVDFEVSFGLALLGGLGLTERLVLTQMLAHHLLQVGLVGGLGDDALLLQHGQDTHLLLNELDGDDQIHTKVDESPLDALTFVLFLLLNEHVVVEELLEALVGVVDKELFQDVELEDLKTGNIQDTDEISSGVGRVQGVVDQQDDPIEHTGEEGLGGGGNGEADLVNVLALLDEILADLQLGLHEGVDEPVDLDLEEVSSPGHHIHTVRLSLLLATLLLPLLVTDVGDGDGTLVQTILLILAEAKGIQGGVSGAHLLGVIHTGDGQHALSEEKVISWEGLVAQLAELPVLGIGVGHQLVEDMVISLDLQLEGDTGLLQKVGLDIV